jgi:large subunit ribosomal protein L33
VFRPLLAARLPTFRLAASFGTLCGFVSRSLPAMAKSKKKAEVVFLVCEETGDLNYILRRKPGGEKLKLKKYSPRVRKHTLHVEKKK